MKNRWSEKEVEACVAAAGDAVPRELAQQVYATRLLGGEPDLAMHGGGNTSLKTSVPDLLHENRPALFVKASGVSMARATADHFVALDLDKIERLRTKGGMDDAGLADFFRLSLLLPSDRLPSIETLLHLFLPHTFIDHTHPSAILALTNRHDAAACLSEALGKEAAVIPYATVGFECARASMEALRRSPDCTGLVIMHHGLVTWGTSAKGAYDATISLVSRAEEWCSCKRTRPLRAAATTVSVDAANARYASIAPMLRGLLCPSSGNADAPFAKVALKHSANGPLLELLASSEAAAIVSNMPLTPDYLIRIRRRPLFIGSPLLDNEAMLRDQIKTEIERYKSDYQAYIRRSSPRVAVPAAEGGFLPKVLLVPGVGSICAGATADDAAMADDIIGQCLSVKRTIHETGGTYAGLSEEHCIDMEFRPYQRAKLEKGGAPRSPAGSVALVTGAAGAIGAGICTELLEAGCNVAISDLAGEPLDTAVRDFSERYGAGRVLGVAMDVTDAASVEQGFARIAAAYGGIDLVVVNAGIAHVAVLAEMDIDSFKRLERVNIEGTLLTIREAARLFKKQNIGGDIVLVSTKNVFAPGASFGAYSATKAAAHQLARIASIELADIGVRVNMVSPDAVFSHGARKSGLWAEVGPGRMRARGLDEAGLEEYYRTRNLLKMKVTAKHVAAAVLFFFRHETPTTGATIPVDGGLPDSTPR